MNLSQKKYPSSFPCNMWHYKNTSANNSCCMVKKRRKCAICYRMKVTSTRAKHIQVTFFLLIESIVKLKGKLNDLGSQQLNGLGNCIVINNFSYFHACIAIVQCLFVCLCTMCRQKKESSSSNRTHCDLSAMWLHKLLGDLRCFKCQKASQMRNCLKYFESAVLYTVAVWPCLGVLHADVWLLEIVMGHARGLQVALQNKRQWR